MKKAGVLLAVSSMPSNNGIGDFGQEAYEFIDILKTMGFQTWQILPLNPMGHGNSPYQPFSSYAMDEIYINLDRLKMDLSISIEIPAFNKESTTVNYEKVRAFKNRYLLQWASDFKPNKKYEEFIKIPWAYPYALYRTFRKLHHDQLWNEWPEPFRDFKFIKNMGLHEYQESIQYELFLQYTLYEQWMDIKKYAQKQGVEIIGDLPIYVGLDSADVWSNREQFLLDETGRPTFIAGVPPDYFSSTGQRWGNPLYDWSKMEEDEFSFWKERLGYNSVLFDCVRIDHFRAFDTYWKIPVACTSAIEGSWEEAPGYALFDELFNSMPNLQIIAEDLGLMRQEVYDLRDHYNLKGMRIIQFSYDPNHLYPDRENCIIYTGTHDNQTLRSWFDDQDKEHQALIQESLKKQCFIQGDVVDRFIKYAFASNASIAIIPMQDLLGLDDNSRMNTPGTVNEANWCWKMNSFESFKSKKEKLKRWIKQYRI